MGPKGLPGKRKQKSRDSGPSQREWSANNSGQVAFSAAGVSKPAKNTLNSMSPFQAAASGRFLAFPLLQQTMRAGPAKNRFFPA